MRGFLVLVGIVALAGCSSSSSNGTSPGGGGQDGGGAGDDGGGGGSACTEQALGELIVPTIGGTLVDVAADAKGLWLLVLKSDGSLTVARPGQTGETHVLETSNVVAPAITTGSDGKVCAAWGLGKPYGVHTACAPDFTVVDTKLTTEIDPSAPLAYREGAEGGGLLFEGKYASLTAATRDATGWREEDMMESSISYPGSARALSGTTDGAPYCFVADEGAGAAPVLVHSWGRSGSANDFGAVTLDGNAAAKTCGVAMAGTTLGVLVTGSGQAKFAVAAQDPGGFAGKLTPEAFDAQGISAADLAATSDGFVAVYTTSAGTFRATRAAGAAGFTAAKLALPPGETADHVSVVVGPSKDEHVVLQNLSGSSPKFYYQRSCHGPS